MSHPSDPLLERLERLLDRVESLLPPPPRAEDDPFAKAVAFRWRGLDRQPSVVAIPRPNMLALADIRCIERQKTLVVNNTRQFLAGLPANNVLLWGSRGTGKSSLIKALLHDFADRGLRLIEVERRLLKDLPDIVDRLSGRTERFILFADDLSFEENDEAYKGLKACLEGSLGGLPENVLIYASSNRRHLLPEFQSENQQARYLPGEHLQVEIHHGDAVEEKISLAERFGLWISFHPFTQDEYLEVVRYWLDRFDCGGDYDEARPLALRFALERGSRSGRVAWQFAKQWAGMRGLETGG